MSKDNRPSVIIETINSDYRFNNYKYVILDHVINVISIVSNYYSGDVIATFPIDKLIAVYYDIPETYTCYKE